MKDIAERVGSRFIGTSVSDRRHRCCSRRSTGRSATVTERHPPAWTKGFTRRSPLGPSPRSCAGCERSSEAACRRRPRCCGHSATPRQRPGHRAGLAPTRTPSLRRRDHVRRVLRRSPSAGPHDPAGCRHRLAAIISPQVADMLIDGGAGQSMSTWTGPSRPSTYAAALTDASRCTGCGARV